MNGKSLIIKCSLAGEFFGEEIGKYSGQDKVAWQSRKF